MAIMTPYDTNKQLYNLDVIESVARQKYRSVRVKRAMNIVFIFFEYALYLACFTLLFNWRVMPEFNIFQIDSWKVSLVDDYVFLYCVIMVIYSIIMINRNMFSFYKPSSFTDDLTTLVKAVLISFLIATGLIFLLKTGIVYSRLVIVIYSAFIILIAAIIRLLKRMLITYLKKKELLTRNVLIIGAGKIGEEIERFIVRNKSSGYRIVGFLDDHKKQKNVLGKIKDLEIMIQTKQIDEVYITIPSERNLINNTINTVRKYDVDIKIIPEMYNFMTTSVQFNRTDAFPYMQVVKTPLRGINLFLKRLVDIVLSSIGILLCLPLLAITAVMIKIDSRGPIIFKQERIGKNGVPFSIYKFRSMVANAEQLKEKLKDHNEADGPVFKIKKDPRITRLGHILRKYSIDELPQLFNVLRGDMSLIGPRPPLPTEVEQYTDIHWRRLDVRPGISGLWQVSGRSDISFEEWVNLDIYYIENWNIALDIKIFLRTIPVVLFGKGAY